jgi:hypothetical protein
MLMYRESVDSMAAEITRLRTELEQLRADDETARRLTAPKRGLRAVGAAILCSAVAANLFAALAIGSYRRELDECRLENRVVYGELAQGQADHRRLEAERDAAQSERDKAERRANKLLALLEACRMTVPELLSSGW